MNVPKCIGVMLIKVHFKRCVALLIFSWNVTYFYFHLGLENLEIQNMIYLHLNFNLSKIDFFSLAYVYKYCFKNG
jgi:hypothetical protein